MIAQYLDVTAAFNANSGTKIEVSNYDYCVVQFVTPTGEISFTASNDSGAIQGVTDGGIDTSMNYETCSATKLSDGTLVTSANESGLYRFGVVGRYIQFAGAGEQAEKVLVMLAKIG